MNYKFTFQIMTVFIFSFVVISAFVWYFVAFCQRLIYEYMDMDMEVFCTHRGTAGAASCWRTVCVRRACETASLCLKFLQRLNNTAV